MQAVLISDGSSDRALMPAIKWSLQELGASCQVEWADNSVLPSIAAGLAARIRAAVHLYPADLLIVQFESELEGALAGVRGVA
jgi:hypothetical protein